MRCKVQGNGPWILGCDEPFFILSIRWAIFQGSVSKLVAAEVEAKRKSFCGERNGCGSKKRYASVQDLQSVKLRCITATATSPTLAKDPRSRAPNPFAWAFGTAFSDSTSWPAPLVPRCFFRLLIRYFLFKLIKEKL